MHLNKTGVQALDVWAFGKPVSFDDIPDRGRDYYIADQPDVQFRIARQFHFPPRVKDPTYEYIYIHTPELVFAISPAHAAVDFRSSPLLALKYSHLDLFFIDVVDAFRFGGILPQLWGVIPMSKGVKAMTVEPSSMRPLNGTGPCMRSANCNAPRQQTDNRFRANVILPLPPVPDRSRSHLGWSEQVSGAKDFVVGRAAKA